MAGVNALYGILVEAGADENVVDIVSCKMNWKTGALGTTAYKRIVLKYPHILLLFMSYFLSTSTLLFDV